MVKKQLKPIPIKNHRLLLLFLVGIPFSWISQGCTPHPVSESVILAATEVEMATQITDSCGRIHYQIRSGLTVDNLIKNVQLHIAKNSPTIEKRYFFFVHFSYEELVELHTRLYSLRSTSELVSYLKFNLRDYMLRLSLVDHGALVFFRKHVLFDKNFFDQIETSQFHTLSESKECPMRKLSQSFIEPQSTHLDPVSVGAKQDNDQALLTKQPIRVFHAAMEAPNFKVGGVGSYLSGLVQAESHHKNSAGEREVIPALITPNYDTLRKNYFHQMAYVGYIDHEVSNMAYRSTVYKISSNEIDQYLIQPDLSYRWDLFDIVDSSHLYQNFGDEKWLYFSSAVASFAGLFHGKTENEQVDLLHINDWHLGFTSALVNLEINPKRKAAGLPEVATVATTHELNAYQGQTFGSYLFTQVGLPQPPTKQMNMQAFFQVFSNASNTVSKTIASEMQSPEENMSFGLGSLFSKLAEVNRFRGITNGIEIDQFDPTKKQNLGNLAVKEDLSDIAERKIQAKEALFRANIIGSPSQPLFLYVGRLSREKGIDVLPHLATELVRKYGAQVVIMGPPTDAQALPILKEITELTQDPSYLGLIRLYTDVKKDQLTLLEDMGAQKGKLIRFAADFTIVPSIEESCGLVPIEALAMGSGIFTSFVHGLKDLCKPFAKETTLHPESTEDSQFTCFTFNRFEDSPRTLSGLDEGLRMLMGFWENLSPRDQEKLQKRWIIESREFRWSKPGGAVDQYLQLYRDAMEPPSSQEKALRLQLRNSWVNFYSDRSFTAEAFQNR